MAPYSDKNIPGIDSRHNTGADNSQLDNLQVNDPQAIKACGVYCKFWKETTVGIISLSILLALLLTQTHFSINRTPSLVYKAFICVKGAIPRRGDFVSIQNHPTQYFEGIHYTKRLIGLPGDKIQIQDNQIAINPACSRNTPFKTSCASRHGPRLIGPLWKVTQDGKPLHPLKATIIPEGYVFVSGDHPHSFDSRYEEFGLVKQEHIAGKCFGLFESKINVQERDQ